MDRLYAKANGAYLSTLPKVSAVAGQQLKEALERRAGQRDGGDEGEGEDGGMVYSCVLREDEVMIGRE